MIESIDSVVDDLKNHVDLVDETFGGKQVPRFIIGYSLGGFLTLKLNAIMQERYFSRIALLAPFL